jgi:hypothetical protein
MIVVALGATVMILQGSRPDAPDIGATDPAHVAAAHALLSRMPAADQAMIDPYQSSCLFLSALCETSATLSPAALVDEVTAQLVAAGGTAKSRSCKMPTAGVEEYAQSTCSAVVDYHGSRLALGAGSALAANPNRTWLRITTATMIASLPAPTALGPWTEVDPLPAEWAARATCTVRVSTGCDKYEQPLTDSPLIGRSTTDLCSASAQALTANGYLITMERTFAATSTHAARCLLFGSRFRTAGARDGVDVVLLINGKGPTSSALMITMTVSPYPSAQQLAADDKKAKA